MFAPGSVSAVVVKVSPASMVTRAGQFQNMYFMLFTFRVSKLDMSSSFKFVHSANMYSRLVAAETSRFFRSQGPVRLSKPRNQLPRPLSLGKTTQLCSVFERRKLTTCGSSFVKAENRTELCSFESQGTSGGAPTFAAGVTFTSMKSGTIAFAGPILSAMRRARYNRGKPTRERGMP